MTSRRWNTLVSVLVLALVLATAGSARAQWGFPGIYNQAGISQVGVPYGSWPAYGGSPYGYGAFAGTGYAGPSNFIGFPQPGYSLSIGQRPLTTTSFQSVSDVVTLAPSWSGSAHRVHRRFPARPSARRGVSLIV